MSLHMLGADASLANPYTGLYGGIIQAAGNLAQGGLNAYDADQAAQKASIFEKAKLTSAVNADRAAALAKAAALTSEALAASATGPAKAAAQAKASADQTALGIAESRQEAAAAALGRTDPERVEAANNALEEASKKLQANSTDIYAQSLVKAWQWVCNKAQNAQIVKAAPEGPRSSLEEGFLQRKLVGPVRAWHAGVGAGVVGLGWYAFKKGVFSRLFGG